jgi:hypothetical protein
LSIEDCGLKKTTILPICLPIPTLQSAFDNFLFLFLSFSPKEKNPYHIALRPSLEVTLLDNTFCSFLFLVFVTVGKVQLLCRGKRHGSIVFPPPLPRIHKCLIRNSSVSHLSFLRLIYGTVIAQVVFTSEVDREK